MYSYITKELPALLAEQFTALDMARYMLMCNGHNLRTRCKRYTSTCFALLRLSIMGHSMGGHGALTIALKNPTAYRCGHRLRR